MKRLALVAAVFALAACAKKDETPAADTSAAMAPAPAVTDTAMKMDTTAMSSTPAVTTTTTTTTTKKK
ncbi:MAG: hypothetical protein M3Z17_08485 [Gemmatimonadota bacterium]|nr:hypothetical protein [Gemmatimonadota bacterium]